MKILKKIKAILRLQRLRNQIRARKLVAAMYAEYKAAQSTEAKDQVINNFVRHNF